jgi:hypothetical protein
MNPPLFDAAGSEEERIVVVNGLVDTFPAEQLSVEGAVDLDIGGLYFEGVKKSMNHHNSSFYQKCDRHQQ